MAESFEIQGTSREEKYQSLLPQIRSLVEGEPSRIANLANIMSALKYGMGFFWVGVYFAEGNELVLGPFQGPVACTRITKGKGVCGTVFAQKKTIVVEDVERFPGHIACSSLSRSEIVLPVLNSNGEVTMVLDVDSEKLADFSEVDARYLGMLTELMAKF